MRFKRICWLAGLWLLVHGWGLAGDPTGFQSAEFQFEKRIVSRVNYLLHFPAGYAADPNRRWPLVLFLHGSGQRGTNLDLVTTHGPPKLAKAGHPFPFLLLAPQCPPNERWQNDVLLGLLDQVQGQHRVDTNRVYLTGLSMGGYATWYLGMKYPHRFAALAPVCGGGQILDVQLADDRRLELQRMPVWAFHGVKDQAVPVRESRQMVEGLKEWTNTKARLTEYPDLGHDCWTVTYENPEFYAWLLAQNREGRFQPAR
jgi:predicted peptidase